MKQRKMTAGQIEELWRSPANWRARLFYYCPEDPRVIVPKRQKWRGWTVNFARPSAGPILVASIIFTAGPLIYLATQGLVLSWAWWTTLVFILLLTCVVCRWLSSPGRHG